MGIKRSFYIFKPIIPLLPNSLRSRLVKLGPSTTRSWEKGAQELHIFAHNRDHMYNSQMCIQIWSNICKWRILAFKNNLYSGQTRIDRKTIWIWSKWEKEFLNVTSAREPTCISQMEIKKLFCIFKPMIPLLPNRLHSELVKLGARMTRSWEKGSKHYTPSIAINTMCTTLKWVSKYNFIFANEEFFFSKIAFIRG